MIIFPSYLVLVSISHPNETNLLQMAITNPSYCAKSIVIYRSGNVLQNKGRFLHRFQKTSLSTVSRTTGTCPQNVSKPADFSTSIIKNDLSLVYSNSCFAKSVLLPIICLSICFGLMPWFPISSPMLFNATIQYILTFLPVILLSV